MECKWVPLCELVFFVIGGWIFTLQASLHMTLYVYCNHQLLPKEQGKDVPEVRLQGLLFIQE